MTDFININGINVIFSKDSNWPSPCNVFVIRDDKGFSLIDTGCGGASGIKHLTDGLSHFGLEIENLHTVILTHAHPDHMGGMWWILENASPEVFIHKDDIEAALDPSLLPQAFDLPLAREYWAKDTGKDDFKDFNLLGYFEYFNCSMSSANRAQALDEGKPLILGDRVFKVIHTPGHAPGHVSLFEENNRTLLGGDLIGRFPAWYTPSSGGLTGYLKGLEKLDAVDADVLIPAHGPADNEPRAAIERIRAKLEKREAAIIDALGQGPKSLMELNRALFKNQVVQFFPGIGVIESHLVKLETEGVIKRDAQSIVLR